MLIFQLVIALCHETAYLQYCSHIRSIQPCNTAPQSSGDATSSSILKSVEF